ncbi:metallo-beta-lactamase domain-containing protein 1 [Latimeria chalumnae]|uniref:Metallo-beta-lactamase domain-containing protein 1 n=1 Tax=Latimeria chalumnae TaxID=7897 RepID=H3AER7_LATCH|nr:PREDICTED: metallo-beta-lactamase domain-containing protein 1 [Latimeria chalumnae]|eukprot:XP_006011355.1 PREDICTED: metallo-beta-lactamase domain-containing protein 1 [Latimeria chalumnae]
MSGEVKTKALGCNHVPGDPYSVFVVKEGYAEMDIEGNMKADGTITLIKGKEIILVDTGSPWDKEIILKYLSTHSLTPEDIRYVICTHGHSDHVGNLNLFPNATFIVSYDVCNRDAYLSHDFRAGRSFRIDEYVEVFPTPGHTGSDVSVLVRGTARGTVVVAGDLFEREGDGESWKELSENPEAQEQNRMKVLEIADVVIPGHGGPFQVIREGAAGK